MTSPAQTPSVQATSATQNAPLGAGVGTPTHQGLQAAQRPRFGCVPPVMLAQTVQGMLAQAAPYIAANPRQAAEVGQAVVDAARTALQSLEG